MTPAQRQQALRDRRRAEGKKVLTEQLSEEAIAQLDELRHRDELSRASELEKLIGAAFRRLRR